MTKIPQVLVLVLVVSAFATAFTPPVGDSDGAPATGPAAALPSGPAVSAATGPSVSAPSVTIEIPSGPIGALAADPPGNQPAESFGGLMGDLNGAAAPAPGPSGRSILIYGPSMGALVPPLWDYNEETVATALGHGVTVADPQTWMGLTAADFGAFDAIVFGDPKCEIASTGTVLLEPANVNKAVWSSVVDGPMIVLGTTPQFSQFSPSPQDRELIANGIDFAASGPGTGLYVSLGCWYLMEPSNTPVAFLSEIGDFQVGGREGCTGTVTIVDPAHPAMAGITTLGEPDWACASQELITTFPTSFGVLATAVRPSDGADLPFIIASSPEAPIEPPVDPPVDPPIDPPIEPPEDPDDPPFAEFWAEIEWEDDEVEVEGGFRLGEGHNGIDPENEVVIIEIGAYSFTIPVGSFELDDDDEWEFEGVIDGMEVEMEIERDGDNTFEFEFEIEDADLDGLEDPVRIWLEIGNDNGETYANSEYDDDEDEEDDVKDEDDEDDDEDDEDEEDDEDDEDDEDEEDDDEDEEDDDD